MNGHASMNRIYRLVWNKTTNVWVAVAETAKGRSKGGSSRSKVTAEDAAGGSFALHLVSGIPAALLGVMMTLATPLADAASAVNAVVSAGAGSVSTVGTTTSINQSSQRLAIDWTSLSTQANESLRFFQPNAQAIALNRIIGSSPSALLGSLTANGQVFILNPNGVLFGAGSQVNVGSLVASTLSMTNPDFMAGNYVFTKDAIGSGSVINQGTLTAANGGYLALLAPEVRNEGVMAATLGTALLAAGNKVTLNLNNGSLLGYSIDQGAINALADNKQLIQASGGQVILSAKAADALGSAVVNNTGIIEAKSLTSVGGKILLEGDFVSQTGKLVASGVAGGQVTINGRGILDAGTVNADGSAGNGGQIVYRASQAIVQTAAATLNANANAVGGTIDLQAGTNIFSSGSLNATGSKGGSITTLASNVTLAAATLDASGRAQGGSIRVGGDFHGASAGGVNAQTTFVNGVTTLKANGGNGKVVVWSDRKTDFYGSISANNGSTAEVSSKGTLSYGGQAQLGATGTLLLDPANIIITDNAGPAAFALKDPNSAANNNFGDSTTLLGTGVNNNNSERFLSVSSVSSASPAASSTFKENGKVVVSSPGDSLGGSNAGAVYLFDTTTGALISSLNGSHANDQVGSSDITVLTNGNYVVSSGNWSSGKGAVTFGSGTTGVSGVVADTSSLVGSTSQSAYTQYGNTNYYGGDHVGSNGVTALANGNYIVNSSNWNLNQGAVTFGSGTTGVKGLVSSTNSLVGTTQGLINMPYDAASTSNYYYINGGDQVGNNGITALTNGNYVVSSGNWSRDKGAVTFGSGTAGVSGAVSADNSLVGATSSTAFTYNRNTYYYGADQVGKYGVTALANGNYIVNSSNWNLNQGAVTFGSGTVGVKGLVSSTNSLVGTNQGAINTPYNSASTTTYYSINGGDQVGNGRITSLANGNYLVSSVNWSNNKGAVTFGSGTAGAIGVVAATNSLIGSTGGDYVGNYGITALTNGNYVVRSSNWGNNKGAVTFGSGTIGISGVVADTNSLVGSTAGDNVGNYGVTELSNGNYVIQSTGWYFRRGAVTFGSGTTGVSGVVAATNSLVGSTFGDIVGNQGITALTNGNYVVHSSNWSNNKGAVTFGSGTTGIRGVVADTNSLVGSTTGDNVGNNGITALTNGNYLVGSSRWSNNKGAVTFGSGTTGISGIVADTNSLVGSTTGDNVGSNGITALTNGNYVVVSRNWSNNKGAVTFGSGTNGISGVVADTNSLVGSTAGDNVGNNGITALTNGNYVVVSSNWSKNKGAVTFGSGTAGVSGAVSADNSLVGTSSGTSYTYYGSQLYYGADQVGSDGVTALANGNYIVSSSNWALSQGAVTFGNGATGVKGLVSSTNSLVGTTQGLINMPYDAASTSNYYYINGGDQVGNNGITALTNGNYVVSSGNWSSGKGAVTFGSGTAGVSGAVSADNSLVGATSSTAFTYNRNTYYYGADQVGVNGITALANGNYTVNSSNWNLNKGAVTFGSGTTGVKGLVSSTNSLVGTTQGLINMPYDAANTSNYYYINGGDQVGSNQPTALANGKYLVSASNFASYTGEVLIGTPGDISYATGTAAGSTLSLNSSGLTATLAGGTAVTLQASNDITVNANINVSGNTGGAFTLQAGRNINLNSIIKTADGNFTAVAGDAGAIAADRIAGTPAVTLGAGAVINAGTGVITLAAVNGNFINNTGSATPLTAARYLVYSTKPTLDAQGGLTAEHVGNAQAYTGTTPAYASMGNWFFYSGTPADVAPVAPTAPVAPVAPTAPVAPVAPTAAVPPVTAATPSIPAALSVTYASALDDATNDDRQHHQSRASDKSERAKSAPLINIVSCGVATLNGVEQADCE